ncbi:MAG: Rdx family protein [Planctomycetes bacterium]|nr:Rdx family protein [Planctomycetota bacterium]
MGAAIQKAFPEAKVELKPGGRGDFIVTVDGRQLWDKKRQGDQFPEPKVIVAAIRPAG